MTTLEVMEQQPGLMESHARLIESRNGDEPKWLRSMRQHAFEQFAARGYPTPRDEEWRFTNLAPLAKTQFELPALEARDLAPEQVRRIAIPNLNSVQLVFVDGRFSSRLSQTDSLPAGVTILSLADAVQSRRELVQPHLDAHALHKNKADAFTWLNTAFVEDGAFIHVAKNVIVDRPIEVLAISTSQDAPVMTHPRNIIIADENAEVTVIERYVSIDAGVYFTNAVTDILAGDNAAVHHYLIEEEGGEAFNTSTLRTRQTRDSNVDSHTILLGGKLVRNNVHAILDGEGSQCLINGLYIGSDQQHMDNHMRVEHARPHGDSRQFYKGILNDKSTAVFSGRIIVHPGAQKTDAKQTNKNLLLSDESHVDTQPQLEIYADDVKCTHGATIGQLDEEAIFYFRARGISNDTARSMLIHSFAGESLSRMKNEAIRIYLDKILFARLPGGDLLEHMH